MILKKKKIREIYAELKNYFCASKETLMVCGLGGEEVKEDK